MQHVIVLSYFSNEEAERYKQLADVLAQWPRSRVDVSCLICSVVTGVEEDPELVRRFSALMPTRSYRCRTPVVGYPQRPTAMFWEIMEHIASVFAADGGFALWFEADMVPTRPTWLGDLDARWRSHGNALVMGRLQPHNYVPTIGIVVRRHINGGACYAKNYARMIPPELKQGTFDLMPWSAVKRTARYVATELFAFGTNAGLEREMQGRAAVLHGYRQDKPAFYRAWSQLARGQKPVAPTQRCCDLFGKHLGVEYCPIHSARTLPVRVVNSLSVYATWPYFVARRRLRLLSKRFES